MPPQPLPCIQAVGNRADLLFAIVKMRHQAFWDLLVVGGEHLQVQPLTETSGIMFEVLTLVDYFRFHTSPSLLGAYKRSMVHHLLAAEPSYAPRPLCLPSGSLLSPAPLPDDLPSRDRPLVRDLETQQKTA